MKNSLVYCSPGWRSVWARVFRKIAQMMYSEEKQNAPR